MAAKPPVKGGASTTTTVQPPVGTVVLNPKVGMVNLAIKVGQRITAGGGQDGGVAEFLQNSSNKSDNSVVDYAKNFLDGQLKSKSLSADEADEYSTMQGFLNAQNPAAVQPGLPIAAAAAAAAAATQPNVATPEPNQANAKPGGGAVGAAVQPKIQPPVAAPAGGLQLTGARPQPAGPKVEMEEAGKEDDEAKMSAPGAKKKADKTPKEEFKGGSYDFWENLWKTLLSIGSRLANVAGGLYKNHKANKMIEQGEATGNSDLLEKGRELKDLGLTQIMQGLDHVGVKNANDLIQFGKDAYQAYKAGGPGGVQDMVRNRMNDTANARNAPKAPDAPPNAPEDLVEMVDNPMYEGKGVEYTDGAKISDTTLKAGEAFGIDADQVGNAAVEMAGPNPAFIPKGPQPGGGGQNIEVDATLVSKAGNVNKDSQAMQNSAGESLAPSTKPAPTDTTSTTPAATAAAVAAEGIKDISSDLASKATQAASSTATAVVDTASNVANVLKPG